MRAAGPSSRVVGVDIAEPLLALARERAVREGLGNAELVHADATNSGFADGSFDVVICVFGVFFVADMPAFVREMWRLVRPGGRLAVTTWGPDTWEPADGIFRDSVRGSGCRATFDALDDAERDAVHAAVLDRLRRQQVTEFRTDAVLATATRPPS